VGLASGTEGKNQEMGDIEKAVGKVNREVQKKKE